MDKGIPRENLREFESRRSENKGYVRPAKVICDYWACVDRGEYPRCYLREYKFCIHYKWK